MARSFTYDRPLDVKIIPASENTNHEFQRVLGIKKEVEDVPPDEEIGLPETESANNLQPASANTSKMPPIDGKGETHPHLVIKFRDLLTRSGQSYGRNGKNKKREREYLTEDKLTSFEADRIKRRRSESSRTSKRRKSESSVTSERRKSESGVTSERRNTRSSILQQIRSNCDNVKKSATLNSSKLKETNDKAKNKTVRNSTPMIDLSKSGNMHINCDVCGLHFTSYPNLQAHKNYYSTDGKYQCNLCGLRFSRFGVLSRHKRVAHSTLPRQYWYRYKCDICMDHFKTRISLIVHTTHLHAKELTSNKKSERLYKEVVLSNIVSGKRRRPQTSVKNSKRSMKSAAPSNFHNSKVSSVEITQSYTDFIESVGDTNNKDKQIGETFRSEQDSGCQNISLDNQATNGAVDSNNEKVNRRSTRQSLKYVEESNSAQCDGDKVMTQQKLEPLIKDSEKTCIGLKKSQEVMGNSVCSSKRVFNENGGMQESKDHSKQLHGLPRGSERSLSNLSQDGPPQLQQDSFQGIAKSANESVAKEFDLQQDGTNEKKISPSYEQLNYQVGIVLSHDELEEKVDLSTMNIDVDNSAVKRINCGNNLNETNDFGDSRESIFVGHQDKDVDVKNCESISLSMAVSALGVPLIGSDNIEFHDATMLRNYEIPYYQINKDVKVSLVKLENMVDLPEINTPKSSVCDIIRLTKTEKPNCYVSEKPFANRGRWRISRQKERENVEYNKKSRSFVKKTHGAIGYCPQVLSNDGASEERGEWETAKQPDRFCYVCNKVFQSKGSLVSHYIKIHIEPGSFRCCLCNAHLKRPKRLRSHIFKHCHTSIEQICRRFCRSCNGELNIFSLKNICADCIKGQRLSRGKVLQRIFGNISVLDKQQLAHTLACEKISPSDNSRELLHETLGVISPKDVKVISAVDDSAENGLKVQCSTTSREISKNSKCSGSNRSFSQSSMVQTDLECRKPKTQIGFMSHGYKKMSRTCSYKSRTKTLKVGSKKRFKSINFAAHDKECIKKLITRSRPEFFQRKTRSVKRRMIGPHFRSNTRKSFHHRCKTCGLNCCCSKNLEVHERRYSTEGKNSCKTCGLTFAWKHVLVVHMKMAHNPKPLFSRRIRCEICNQGFYNKKFLRIHLAHFHNIKFIQCQVSEIKFDTSQYLNDRRRYYSKTINLPCHSCDKTFNSKYALEYHKVQIHNAEEPKVWKYSCSTCDCAFPDKLSLQAHVRHLHVVQDNDSVVTTHMKGAHAPADQHLEDIEFSDKTEDAFINSNIEMNGSISGKHKNEIQCDKAIRETTNSPIVKTHILSQYKCDICKISFMEPHDILDHEWEYSNYGTNACDVCNRKFMTKSHLEKHKVKHFRKDAICMYKCHVCKEDFTMEDDLKMHGLHLHGPQFMFEKISETSESRESSISNCEKVHDTDDTLDVVMGSGIAEDEGILLFQKISNRLSAELVLENSYCCDFCTVSFGTRSLLTNHMKKHAYRPYYTNSSKYLCLICKNTFRTNDILRAHVIHYHTLDHKQSTTSEPEPLEKSIPDESLKSQTSVNRDSTSIDDQDVQDTVETSPSKHANLNQSLSLPKDCSAVDDSSTTPSEAKSQSSNFTDDVHEDQQNHENISTQAEVTSVSIDEELFTSELEKLICTICTQNFDSTEEIRAHFTSVHMMNGEYACTFCGEIFSYFMDLKRHIFGLDDDSENYTCCREKLRQVMKLAGNTSSPKNHHENKQNEENLQISLFHETDTISKSSEKPSSNNLITLGQGDICDESFSNFTTSLKRWDSYFDKDQLRCDLCDITFIDQRLLNIHNMKHHENGQELYIARNQQSLQLNLDDRTVQIRMQYEVMLDNKLQDGAAITSSLVNTNISGNLRRVPISSDKLLKQTISSSLQSRVAKIQPIAENENEPDINEQINAANDASSKVDSQLNLESQQDTDLSNKLDDTKRCETEQSVAQFRIKSSASFQSDVNPVQSTSSVGIRYHESSSEIPRNSSDENLTYKMVITGTNDDIEKRYAPIKDIEYKCTQQKQPSLQSHVLSTGRNLVSIVPTMRRSRTPDHTYSSRSQKSRSSDCADEKRLEIVPLSSDDTGNSIYLVCIQPTVDSSNDSEVLDVVSTPIEKPHVKEHTANKLSRLLPSTSGPDVRPFNYKRVESSSEFGSELDNNKPTVAPKDRNLKPHLQGGVQKRRLKILPIRSNVVISPLRSSSFERNSKAGNGDGNNLPNGCAPRGGSSGGNGNTKVLTRHNVNKELQRINNILRCSYCTMLFKTQNQLVEHMLAHKANNQCPACGLSFSNDKALQQHLPEHRSSKCIKCNKVNFFNDPPCYPAGTFVFCTKCNAVLPPPLRTITPTSKDSPDRIMKCGICMETFSTISQMSVHFRKSHLSFLCSICNLGFSSKSNLTKHMEAHRAI
ncbi:uncharacterized protein LOC124413945 isoform X2 [Diprion similis]|uniref:uncharacterized protein LOC124413945 isoform X2 n=1 Tax=Diprion similis TaxID=362088 RepID=UPI001EF8C738|nr:uncharacterized protein LOC124413945 isoform X2 [Diprion similis]